MVKHLRVQKFRGKPVRSSIGRITVGKKFEGCFFFGTGVGEGTELGILRKSKSAQYLGQKVTFEDQENAEIKNRLKAAWAGIPQIPTRTHLESISPTPQITLVQHGDPRDNDLRKWNVDIVSEPSLNDQDRTTKDASPHCPNGGTVQNEEGQGNNVKVNQKSRKTKRKGLSSCNGWRNRRRLRTKLKLWPRQWCFFPWRWRWWNWQLRRRLDWINSSKRSTKEAEAHMKKTNIPCWIETHRGMKWRVAMGIASLPQRRWTSTIIKWNLGLDNKIRTNRSVGRPRKRLEDEINEQLMPEETEEARGNDLKKQQYLEDTCKKTKRVDSKGRTFCKKRQQQIWWEMSLTKSKEVFA